MVLQFCVYTYVSVCLFTGEALTLIDFKDIIALYTVFLKRTSLCLRTPVILRDLLAFL